MNIPPWQKWSGARRPNGRLHNLWSSTEKINPQGRQEEILYNVILKDLYSLSKSRDERLLELDSNLPGIIWGVLIIGAIVTLVFSALLGV